MEKSNIVFLRRIEEARQKRRTLQKQEEWRNGNQEIIDFFKETSQT